MIALALLIASGPKSLHETPEWKAFQAVLAAKPQWSVFVFNKQQNGPHFQFGAIKNGLRIGHSQKVQYIWDGKNGIGLDWSTKTYHTLASAEGFDRFYADGQPFFMRDAEGPLTQLAAYDDAGKKVKTGWSWRYVGRDYEWEASYWFDTKSKLMTEFSFSGNGMVSLPGYEGMYRLHWSFDKEQTKDWSFTPPKDYKRG